MNELALKLMLAGDPSGALTALDGGDKEAREALAGGRIGTALARLRAIAPEPDPDVRPGLSGMEA